MCEGGVDGLQSDETGVIRGVNERNSHVHGGSGFVVVVPLLGVVAVVAPIVAGGGGGTPLGGGGDISGRGV